MYISLSPPPKGHHTIHLSSKNAGDFLAMQELAIELRDDGVCQCSENCKSKSHITLNFTKLNRVHKLQFINILSKQLFSLCHTKESDSASASASAKKGQTKTKTKTYLSIPTFHIVDKPKYADFWAETVPKIQAADLARELASEPSNILYPAAFADRVKQLFKTHKNVKLTVLDEKELKAQGFGLVIGVGQASAHPPRFLVLDLNSNASTSTSTSKTVALLGKGVCFDSGGMNLKYDGGMGMHTDKTGGAIVIGLIHYLAKRPAFAANKNSRYSRYIGVVPLVENMISGSSTKPSDILTAYNKKTVEIVDIDAEGRLILADAMAYVTEKYKPDMVLDFATLTGWASMLFCDSSFAYYTASEKLAAKVEQASETAGERVIRMAKWPEYAKYTVSKVADYKNGNFKCGEGSPVGSGFMAAMFMSNFLPEKIARKKWVHFDITHAHQIGSAPLSNANSFYTALALLERL